MKQFNVGDRVRAAVNHPDGNSYIEHGDIGTVIGLDDSWDVTTYFVEWDKFVGGHTCGGRCRSGYGWNADGEQIELAEDNQSIEYDAVSTNEIMVLLGGHV